MNRVDAQPLSLMPRTRLSRIVRVDQALLAQCARLRTPALTRLMVALTQLGDSKTWIAIAVLLFMLGDAHSYELAMLLTFSALPATALVQLLKRVCKRSRPSHTGFAALACDPDAFSFPSGHTAGAFAVAFAFQGQGALLSSIALVYAGLIGLSRVYLGAHYPLDVGVGTCIGAAAGLAARYMLLA